MALAQSQVALNLIGKLPLKSVRLHGPLLDKTLSLDLLRKGASPEEFIALILAKGMDAQVRVPTNVDVYDILVAQFGKDPVRPAVDFDDTAYFLPSPKLADQFFGERTEFLGNISPWPQVFDCDDLAYCVKAVFTLHRARVTDVASLPAGMAAGIMWCGTPGTGHVMNFVITDQGIRLYDAGPTAKSGYFVDQLDPERLPIRYICI